MPKFYEPEQLKHLQKLEMEILTDFKRICDENNLIYAREKSPFRAMK